MSNTTQQNKAAENARWYVQQQLQAALEIYISVLDHEDIDWKDKEARRNELEDTFALAYDLACANARHKGDEHDHIGELERKLQAQFSVISGTHWLDNAIRFMKGDDNADQ